MMRVLMAYAGVQWFASQQHGDDLAPWLLASAACATCRAPFRLDDLERHAA